MHHAAEAVTRVGSEDQQAIRQAAADRRLYIPARLVPTAAHASYDYVPAPSPRTERLLHAYSAAIRATSTATATLDDLAATVQAPSRLLGDIRMLSGQAALGQPSSPQLGLAARDRPAARPAEASSLQELIGNLSISDPAIHLRAAAIEDAAQALATEAVSQAQRRAAAMDTPSGSHHIRGAATGRTTPDSHVRRGRRQARHTDR